MQKIELEVRYLVHITFFFDDEEAIVLKHIAFWFMRKKENENKSEDTQLVEYKNSLQEKNSDKIISDITSIMTLLEWFKDKMTNEQIILEENRMKIAKEFLQQKGELPKWLQ